MGIERQKRAKVQPEVKTGVRTSSQELDGSTTVEVVQLYTVAEKVTWQSDGDLAGTVEFSVNGRTFEDSTAFTAGAMGTYSSHCVCAVRVTRTGGSGQLHIAAK